MKVKQASRRSPVRVDWPGPDALGRGHRADYPIRMRIKAPPLKGA